MTWEQKVNAYGESYRRMHQLGNDLVANKSVRKANNAKVRAWRLNILRSLEAQEKRQSNTEDMVAIQNELQALNEKETDMPVIDNADQAKRYLSAIQDDNEQIGHLMSQMREVNVANRPDVIASLKARRKQNDETLARLEDYLQQANADDSLVDELNSVVNDLNKGAL